MTNVFEVRFLAKDKQFNIKIFIQLLKQQVHNPLRMKQGE